MEKAVVLVSGGLKSAVLIANAKEQYELHALHVQTGSRASPIEQAAFEHLCERYGLDITAITSLPHLAELSNHPTFTASRRADEGDALSSSDALYVPGLMPALLSTAVAFAERGGIRRILVGASEGSVTEAAAGASGPDQTLEFYHLYNEMLATLLPGPMPIVVDVPLVHLSYGEIAMLGRRLGVPFELTWSCLRGVQQPCGRCAGCRRRAYAVARAGATRAPQTATRAAT